uniref:TOG domain-containing protein n=1 Tax=Piliocolobus tephrosceles TaxID=591936 RepID=A0A8C9HIZ9_9PRIM
MSSKDKDYLKLKYKIISISSNDKEHNVINLLKNTRQESQNAWLSEKNCSYPQEITLQIKEDKIKYLEILSHEYNISKKIEIFVSNNNKDYVKAGFFRFNDNISTKYCARELKYVYLPCTIKCTFIKLKLHGPYHNSLNIHSQVGLYYINIIPEGMSINVISEVNPALLKLNSLKDDDKKQCDVHLKKSKKTWLNTKEKLNLNPNIPAYNITESLFEKEECDENLKELYFISDKNKIDSLYGKLEKKIKCFEKIKGECVAKEEFDMASEIKKIINIFVFLKCIITFLKSKKKKYVREENYGKAKRLKEKEIKIKIIIKNIDELKIVENCSKKWYYEWLILYYKELELYEKELNNILSNEYIKMIKKSTGILDRYDNESGDNDINLNNILLHICSDNETKREIGFDLAYKTFEDQKKEKKNTWDNHIESLCLIVKRGLSDPCYNIFIKSVIILEKMLNTYQTYFSKIDNTSNDDSDEDEDEDEDEDDGDNDNNNNTSNKNRKGIKCIIFALLKRLDNSNLDVVDISIKAIMMMLHNNFTSFKHIFSIILSMLFFFFSGDVLSEVNEKIIVGLMSFYYSLINKYYTTVKNYINLKKVLEIIFLFLEVDIEVIKKTSLDFFVNIYKIMQNQNDIFEDFLSNVSLDTRNLIINRLKQEEIEKEKSQTLKDFNNENKRLQKNSTLISIQEIIDTNTYSNNTFEKNKDYSTSNNSINETNQKQDISDHNLESKDMKNYETLTKYIENNKLIDKYSNSLDEKNNNLKKEVYSSDEIVDLNEKSEAKNELFNKIKNTDSNEKGGNENNFILLSSLHKRGSTFFKQEKSESNTKSYISHVEKEKIINKNEPIEDSTRTDENEDDDVPPFTCKYCLKTDQAFTEVGLEKHWIKNCPMLCACPNCFLIVELVVIYDHFLSECLYSNLYTPCEYCNQIIQKKSTDFHLMEECVAKKNEYLSCYYCSTCIPSFEIDVWRDHLLSCNKNPRLV